MNYLKIYNDIINKAKMRIISSDNYYEIHHITPKSLLGSDEKENLVKLTFKEHYVCHRLLVKIYPQEHKLHYAFWMMSNRANNKNLILSSRQYADARESFIFCRKGIKLSEETKRKISKSRKLQKNDFWIGRKHSKESKNKMSESAYNRTIIEENELKRRDGISKAHKGKVLSEEHVKKISESKMGSKNPMFGKIGENNSRSKKVYQYSKDKILIKIWPNARIAADELELNYKAISACALGKTKSSGNFIWTREEIIDEK